MMVIIMDWKRAPRTGCAGGFPAGSNGTAMDVAGQGRGNGARCSGEDRCRVNRLWPAEGVRATGGIRFLMKQTSTGGSLSPGESV